MRCARAVALLWLAPALAAAQQLPSPPFSDAHVHVNDPEAWVRIMDELAISRSVALAGRAADNAALREAGRRWPGRILPFVSVSPEHRAFRGAWEADSERLAALVDSLLSGGGFYGIGEISVSHYPAVGFPEADFDPSGATMRSLLEVARKHDAPILIHAEITRLREFEALLRDFRDVTVIWAHGGYTPLFLARRLLAAHPNLIYELSARTWARHPRSPDYTIFRNEAAVWPEWLELIESMPERFLVGTDAAGRSAEGDRLNAERVRLFLGQLSEAARARVARENLERILGLPPLPAGHESCEDQNADPWVVAAADRIRGEDDLFRFAASEFGRPIACAGSVAGAFDGAEFGAVLFRFPEGVSFELETMPPAVSMVTLRRPAGFSDPDRILAAVRSYAAGRGLSIRWAEPERTVDGEEVVERYWDPAPGLNASAALTWSSGRLVSVRVSLAP
jgi:predicted TIM-barrel fold metal-dependent hydrolase